MYDALLSLREVSLPAKPYLAFEPIVRAMRQAFSNPYLSSALVALPFLFIADVAFGTSSDSISGVDWTRLFVPLLR